VNVPRRDIQTVYQLTLILTQRLLVEIVWRLKAVTRQKQVQMKSVIRIGAVVEAIEDVSGRASIVQHGEFRRVKKSA